MLEVVCEKSGLINVSRRVYSHEIRQLFLTQNRGSRQTKNRETASEKRKFGCIFGKGKTFTNVKSLFLPLKAPLIKHAQKDAHCNCIKPP